MSLRRRENGAQDGYAAVRAHIILPMYSRSSIPHSTSTYLLGLFQVIYQTHGVLDMRHALSDTISTSADTSYDSMFILILRHTFTCVVVYECLLIALSLCTIA